MLAVEPNVGISHFLRETFQKVKYPSRFFVLNCAVAGHENTGVATFNFYNHDGVSSSLALATHMNDKLPGYANRSRYTPTEKFGPGPAAIDFVPVISFDTILKAIPKRIAIDYLLVDAQGFDLQIIKSASPQQLRRIPKITSETYLEHFEPTYQGVENALPQWIKYMNSIGYKLENPPPETSDGKWREHNAIWIRV